MEDNGYIVFDANRGLGWRVPELLDRVNATEDLYFDAVSQIHLSSWARGRVVLVADAASSVTLFGEGSSLAIIGAPTLADELSRNCDDFAAAFAPYEQRHRLLVDPRRLDVTSAAAFLVPKTPGGIRLWNLLLRVPRMVGALRLRRTSPAVP